MRKLVFLIVLGLLIGLGYWRRNDLAPLFEVDMQSPFSGRTIEDERDLVRAIVDGRRDLVLEALDAGFNPNSRNRFGDSALTWAVNNGDLELAEILLDRGADPNQTGTYGFTSLHWACKKDNFGLIELLLKRGADKNARDESGETPLMIASRNNDFEAVSVLLDAGADPKAFNLKGETALYLAAAHESLDVIEPLVLAGADPGLTANDGESALSLAVKSGIKQAFLTAAIEKRLPNIRATLETRITNQTVNLKERPDYSVPALEKKIHDLVNKKRRQNGLSELAYDSKLAVVARKHSADMAARNFFNHVNPDREDPTARARRERYPIERVSGPYIRNGIGENIFQGFTYSGTHSSLEKGVRRTTYNWLSLERIAGQAVEGWMKSPGHRANILDRDYLKEGIGVVIHGEKVFVTQNFW